MNINRTGIGLRSEHYDQVLSEKPDVPFFEAISENFIGLKDTDGGRPLWVLEQVRKNYPIVLHGVSLSIGSTDPIDQDYLRRLRTLYDRIQPEWVSDHFCWTGAHSQNLHDLLPLPYTQRVANHLVGRIQQVQDALGRQIALENVSSYITFAHSAMTEWEFINSVAKRAGCKILLDVNNIYVSSQNHHFDAKDYIRGINPALIRQYHLAGYSEKEDHLLDTHDHPVWPTVWSLYRYALQHLGNFPALIEWDDRIPTLSRLMEEAQHADRIRKEVRARGTRIAPTSDMAETSLH